MSDASVLFLHQEVQELQQRWSKIQDLFFFYMVKLLLKCVGRGRAFKNLNKLLKAILVK